MYEAMSQGSSFHVAKDFDVRKKLHTYNSSILKDMADKRAKSQEPRAKANPQTIAPPLTPMPSLDLCSLLQSI